MISAIHLRPASASDWPAVQSLLAQNGLPLQGAREHLSAFLVATSEAALVGCAAIEAYGTVALLRSVVVAPHSQRRGIGRRLVEALLQRASRQGIGNIGLLTVSAADFFVPLGFRVEPIERAPAAMRVSAEFQGACPASATFMSRRLAPPI